MKKYAQNVFSENENEAENVLIALSLLPVNFSIKKKKYSAITLHNLESRLLAIDLKSRT